MDRWMTLGVALLVLCAAVPLWMWLAVARNLANVRLQRGESRVVDRAAVPAPHRGILDAAAAEATAMGFVYSYSMQSRPAARVPGVQWLYSDVFVSADGRTQLQLSPSTLPEAGRACTFQWATVWRDPGPHDLTTHCYRHFLMWWPATWLVHDDYLPTVQAAWAAHQQRVDADCAAGRQAQTDVETVRAVCLGLLKDFVPEGERRGYLVPVAQAPGHAQQGSEPLQADQPLWRMRWAAALQKAPALVRGIRRASQAQAGAATAPASTASPASAISPSSALSSTDPSPSPQARLAADLQAFEQHQAYQAELAARSRRKRLALGTTAALFVLVSGVLMSWRTALVLLVVIGLHEGGHWLAMRTLGYRNLSVLFIPGLGGVAMGHKPSASTWNKLAVYLAGPVPGLLLAMGVMASVARGWVAPSVWVQDFVLVCLIINYLNLLPVHPLDGGRVVESLLFVRWPVLRFVFVVAGMCALGALGWFLHDPITLALSGLLALGLPHHWRLMRVDRQVPRGAAGATLSEADAAERIFTALQQPQFARWTFAQRLGAVRALLPELQGTRLGWGGTAVGMAIYLACLLSPAAALWATGAEPLLMAARPAYQYLPDEVDDKSAPTYSASATGYVSPEEWERRLQQAASLPESERLPLYLDAADYALELEDTPAALHRYQQAWALAEPLPASNLLRARTLLGLQRTTEEVNASRAWGLRLLADLPPDADADASLRSLQAQAQAQLAHSAESLAESIERMQSALAWWESASAAQPADPQGSFSTPFHQAAMARSALSRWHMQRAEDGDAQEAVRLLQRNVDVLPVPAGSDRSRSALTARVQRADARLDLAWLLLAQGQSDRTVLITQQVLAEVPPSVTASWVHLQDRALETLVWVDVARKDSASLRGHWQAWQQSARNAASPRRDMVWLLDRWAIQQQLGDTRGAEDARAELLRRAKPGAYWAVRWCGLPTADTQARELADVRELSRRNAAQATGMCALVADHAADRAAEPAGNPKN